VRSYSRQENFSDTRANINLVVASIKLIDLFTADPVPAEITIVRTGNIQLKDTVDSFKGVADRARANDDPLVKAAVGSEALTAIVAAEESDRRKRRRAGPPVGAPGVNGAVPAPGV
jgi:hypothetical protein